jgi:hypothetical protein
MPSRQGVNMNKKQNITNSLVTLMSFVKDQANASLIEQGRRININNEDLRKLTVILEASITNSFMRGIDTVLQEVDKK